MIHRDGISLWVMAAVAALFYLEAAGDPRLWDFEQWRQALLTAALWYVGKNQASRLRGKDE